MKRLALYAGALVALIFTALQAYTQSIATPGPQAANAGAGPAAGPGAVLQQYCFGCHNQKVRSAGLALDGLDLTEIGRDAKIWEKVVRKLRAGMMPPPGMGRPDHAVYNGLITWLEGELDRNSAAPDPLPALHRLNRTEYANAIRDLLGLSIDAGVYLPPDDSSGGFDNMAGALTLSSTLVDAYVSAATAISRLAVGESASPQTVVYRAPEDDTQNYHIEGLPFGTRGGLVVDHIFPSDGEYTISVLPIMGDNGVTASFGSIRDEKLLVLLNGERIALLDWGWKRGPDGDALPMQVRFAAKGGQQRIGITFLATNLAPILDLDRQFMRSTIQTFRTPPELTFFPHVDSIRVEGPSNAISAEDSPTRRRIFICQPAGRSDEDACAKQIVSDLALRAFRRPATLHEIDELIGFYREGRGEVGFDDGIRKVLSHILAAPQFIYRVQGAARGAASSSQDFALASRLSYFLWSAAPDAELLDLASRGRLTSDRAMLEAQVLRMLKDPRSEALTRNFAGQWLNLRSVQNVIPVANLYPDFDDPLRQAMREEVVLFFDSIVREDRSVFQLLNADYTFVNERLALHYGIPNVTGSQFRRVALNDQFDVRRGLLGKAAILAATSVADRTSPVTRGQWIMANLIGAPPPDPPPDVPALPQTVVDTRANTKALSMRQKMLQHRIRQDCLQCHQLMDPLGFSLENFDAVGAWRTEDEGNPVRPSEVLYDGTRVQGVADLRRWLEGYSDQFAQVLCERLLSYALGRGLDEKDMPLVRSITRDAGGRENRFSAFVTGIVTSNTFRMSP